VLPQSMLSGCFIRYLIFDDKPGRQYPLLEF
jgi:hypothetical protein